MDIARASSLPDIIPLEANAKVQVAKAGNLKQSSVKLSSSLPDQPAPTLKETHVMTSKRHAALQKARDAKKVKRIKLDATLEAQGRMNLELGQVLSDMKEALREFRTSKAMPLANVAVQTEPLVQDVLANTPVATLPDVKEDVHKMALAPVSAPTPQSGFRSFLQNKVRF